MQRDIYHSFLARWNKPIPQLLEYAPGGRCRVDREAEGGFWSVFSMAWDLFEQYKQSNDVERGRDIAPTVSLIATAIVDSLSTCSGLSKNDEWLVNEATKLKHTCDELSETKK
jgi:hypothetical protein